MRIQRRAECYQKRRLHQRMWETAIQTMIRSSTLKTRLRVRGPMKCIPQTQLHQRNFILIGKKLHSEFPQRGLPKKYSSQPTLDRDNIISRFRPGNSKPKQLSLPRKTRDSRVWSMKRHPRLFLGQALMNQGTPWRIS